MTREDIIRMARKAGIKNDCDGIWCEADQLIAFATLVYERGFLAGMKNEEQITREEVAAERQRCADIADQHASIEGIAQRIAAEIRGQG